MIYNDGQAPQLRRIYASAKQVAGGYRALVRWAYEGSETQYLADDRVYETRPAAIEVAHHQLMADTDGIWRLGPPKGNKASLSFQIIMESRP